MVSHGLSKSRIVAWKQCPKRLWLQVHRRDLLNISAQVQQSFRTGHEVGEVARTLYPQGILIGDDDDLSAALLSTKMALATHPEQPVFEATFEYDGVLVRVDLLLPTPQGYRMVEVKSSTSVKSHYLTDCAIQAWVLQQNGIALASIELAHIDTGFVYQGNGDYQGLFHHERLDAAVAPLLGLVPQWVEAARSSLAGAEPSIATGPQCDSPFACPFKYWCHQSATATGLTQPAYSLDVFHRMQSSAKDDLRRQGFEDALQVPEQYLNDTQRRIRRISQSGNAELTREAAQTLTELPYPRYYLDFETINWAIPRRAVTSPYRTQVSFQWSCRVEHELGQLQHQMFLDVSRNDPRRACAQALIAALGETGSVFVYFQAFEKSCIAELAALFLDLAPALLAINERIVDLLPLTRASYYHPDMRGSWSLKAVLPTIAPELDYTELAIGSGGDAQEAYRDILHTDAPEAHRQTLTQGLRDYCALDTLAMVRLAWFLQGYAVWRFIPSLIAVLKSQTSKPDPLLHDAEAALRQYCIAANTPMILQPKSYLQQSLGITFAHATLLMNQLEMFGILSPQVPVLSSAGSFSPMASD